MYESDYSNNPVAVELQVDDLGALFARSELKKVYQNVDGSSQYRYQYGEAVAALQFYFYHFSDYCRDMMLYRSRYGVYPKLMELMYFEDYTFQERVELIRTKAVQHENFLYLCKPIVEALHTVSSCERGSDRMTFDEIMDLITTNIPPLVSRDVIDEMFDMLCPDEFVHSYDLDMLYSGDDEYQKVDVAARTCIVVDEDRSHFVKSSFQAQEYEPGLTTCDADEILLTALSTPVQEHKYKSEYLVPLRDKKPYPRTVIRPGDVLNPGDVDVLFDIQQLSEVTRQALLSSRYVARMWDLERRVRKPRVAFTMTRADYRFGQRVVICRSSGMSSNDRTMVLSSDDPRAELEWRLRRKKEGLNEARYSVG